MNWFQNIITKLQEEQTLPPEAQEVVDFLKTRPEKYIACMSKPDWEAIFAYYAGKNLLAASPVSYLKYPELVFKGEAFRKRLPEFIKKFNVELIVSSHRHLIEYPLVFNNGHFQVYKAELDPNPPEFKLIQND